MKKPKAIQITVRDKHTNKTRSLTAYNVELEETFNALEIYVETLARTEKGQPFRIQAKR